MKTVWQSKYTVESGAQFVKSRFKRKVIGTIDQRKYRTILMICFAVVSFLLAAKLSAQSTATDDYLLRLQRSYLLNLMVYSDDPDEKRLAIQRLGKLIDKGVLAQDDFLTINALTRLAQQGAISRIYDKYGNLTNDNFEVRSAACNLLGKLGGEIALARLVSIMSGDTEPSIVAVAMENLVKVDPKGNPTVIEIMVDTFYKYHYTERDNTLAASFLIVSSQYAANSEGRLLTTELLQAVHDVNLPESAYTTPVRSKARSLILKWIGGDYPRLQTIFDQVQF